MAIKHLTETSLLDVLRISSPNASRLLNYRYRSSGSSSSKKKKPMAELLEVDLAAEGQEIVGGIKMLEDVIEGLMVRRLQPDWLPFVPGASYWVPETTTMKSRASVVKLTDLMGKLRNKSETSEEEALSYVTDRGWPASKYYIGGASFHQMEHVLKVMSRSEQSEQSEEEEE